MGRGKSPKPAQVGTNKPKSVTNSHVQVTKFQTVHLSAGSRTALGGGVVKEEHSGGVAMEVGWEGG